MTDHDADLLAVREAVADRAGRADDALPRVWSAISAELAAGERTIARRPVRWLVPAGSAATVAALVLGATALFGREVDDAATLAPAGPPASAGVVPSTLPPFPPPDDHEIVPPDGFLPWDIEISEGLLAEGERVDPGAALAELVAAAELAAPAALGPGQLIYVRSGTELREDWLDPDGMRPLVVRVNGVLFDASEPGEQPTASDASHPTPHWLAALPTDPDALLSLLREETSTRRSSADTHLFKEVGGLLARCDLLLPPEVRVAVYRALVASGPVSAVELDADGRRLLGLRSPVEQPDHPAAAPYAEELLLDPATGRVVGARTLSYEAGGGSPAAVGLSLWTQAVVDEVGQTR